MRVLGFGRDPPNYVEGLDPPLQLRLPVPAVPNATEAETAGRLAVRAEEGRRQDRLRAEAASEGRLEDGTAGGALSSAPKRDVQRLMLENGRGGESGGVGGSLPRETRLTTAEENDFKLVRGRDGRMRKAHLTRAEKSARKEEERRRRAELEAAEKIRKRERQEAVRAPGDPRELALGATTVLDVAAGSGLRYAERLRGVDISFRSGTTRLEPLPGTHMGDFLPTGLTPRGDGERLALAK